MKKINITPLADRVVIETIPVANKTAGGIEIPNANNDKPVTGIVVAAGEGITDDSGNTKPMKVAVGDKVLYSKFSGTEIDLDDQKYLIMREGDIYAII